MTTGRVLGSLALGAAACVAYGTFIESKAFVLRRFDVPVLAEDERPLRVLHISDLHLAPWNHRRAQWVAGLAALRPDLVVNTGDNLGSPHAMPLLKEALGPLLAFPGVFVTGSNDYFGPKAKNPFLYFAGPSERAANLSELPTGEIFSLFESHGWLNLNNTRGSVTVDGRRVSLVGVDDPHIDYDEYPEVRDHVAADSASADLRLGVVHAPYRYVLDRMAAEGADLILAGHTHGGQVCMPGKGALVANCDLPVRLAKGLHPWPMIEGDVTRHKGAWLHVSAGLGSSPFAPFRFACRPEATLLRLVSRQANGG